MGTEVQAALQLHPPCLPACSAPNASCFRSESVPPASQGYLHRGPGDTWNVTRQRALYSPIHLATGKIKDVLLYSRNSYGQVLQGLSWCVPSVSVLLILQCLHVIFSLPLSSRSLLRPVTPALLLNCSNTRHPKLTYWGEIATPNTPSGPISLCFFCL